MKCYHCGTELQNGMTYCPACGAPVGGDPVNSQAPSPDYTNAGYYQHQPPMPPKSNNAVKWTVIILSILTVLVVLGTALFIIFRLNSGMSQKKAYKKYIQIIEQHRDGITEYEEKNDSNSIAFVDINGSGIPDALYITQDENNTPYLHCVTDGERDVEVDAEKGITGELDPEYTMFKGYGKDTIYIRTQNCLFQLVNVKDASDRKRLQPALIAQRTYDESSDGYTYMFLDSDEFKEVSEKEYNDFIDSICNQKTTIILTTLSDDDLNKLFSDVSEDISEKQDKAIKRLKDDLAETGDSTPDSADSQGQETDGNQAEEKDRNFVKDHYLVEYDDVIYYADDDGLWKKEPDSESEKLVSCSATNLATDGQVIYYGAFNDTVSYSYYSIKIDINQYDLYKYDLKTGSNEKLTSFIEAGRPICAVGDTVYYTDFPDDFDGNMAGLAQGICSYNTATGEKKYLCDGAHLTASYDGKIFYREIMAAGGGMGVHQIHCLDTKTESSKEISEDNVISFKVIGDQLYYTINTDFASGTMSSVHYKLCRYDIATEETTELSELTNIKDFDDKYAIGADKQTVDRFDLSSGESEHITLSGAGSNYTNVIRDKKTTYCIAVTNTKNIIYAIDDDSSSADNIGSLSCQSVLAIKDHTAFYIDPSDKNYYFYHIDQQKLD